LSDIDTSRQSPAWMRQKERGSSFLLSIMCILSARLGRSGSRVVLYGIALYFVLFARKARRASRTYLEHCLSRPVTWRDQYKHVLAFASTIHDRLYLLRDKFDAFEISVSGETELHRHYESGQGLLLFGAHLGSFEVLRTLARDRPGLALSMALYPKNARQINRALATINPGAKLDFIELGTIDAMLAVNDKLKSGGLVSILADRASGPDQYLSLPFLGEPARFPTGPFRMAAMLGHPVYFITGLYEGGNRYQLHFELLEDWAGYTRKDRDAFIEATMVKYVALLERYCRTHPYNWFNFYQFWEEN